MSAEVLTDSSAWDECKHGLPTGSCSSCRHPYRPPEKATVEYLLRARYDGHCNGCNLPISVGQPIAKMSDETYRHESCTS